MSEVLHYWNPILESQAKEAIEKKLDEIALYLSENIKTIDGYSLLTGKTGVALFFYYYYLITDNKTYYDLIHELLNEAISEINNESMPYFPHCGGLSGVAWCLDLLYNKSVLSDNAEDIFGKEFNQMLLHESARYLSLKNYDYLHGAIGMMLYLLEKNVDIHPLIQKLIALAVEDENEIKWSSIVPEDKNKECYNLSLAHGNISVLHLLAEAYKKYKDENLREKIEKLARFILRTVIVDESRVSMFPNYITIPAQPDVKASRLAWCYGDLGIGYHLFRAGECINKNELKEKGLLILKINTKRKIFDETFMADACFCHGSTGVAHIYNKIYQATGDVEFKNTAEFWYGVSLNYANHEDGAAGYKTWRKEGSVILPNLIDGVCGIGMSFIAAISPIRPEWDKFFILS